GLRIKFLDLTQRKWRIAKSESFRSARNSSSRWANTHESPAAACQKREILTGARRPRFHANQMPNIRGLPGTLPINANGPPAHLVGEDKRAHEASQHKGVDAWGVPAFAQQRFRSHEHGDAPLLEDRGDQTHGALKVFTV